MTSTKMWVKNNPDSTWSEIKKIWVKKDPNTIWERVKRIWVKVSSTTWKLVFSSANLPQQDATDVISFRYNSYTGPKVTTNYAYIGGPTLSDYYLYGHDGKYTNYTAITDRRIKYAYPTINDVFSTPLESDDILNTQSNMQVSENCYIWYTLRVWNGSDIFDSVEYEAGPLYMIKQSPSPNIYPISITGTQKVNNTISATYSYSNKWYESPDEADSFIAWYRSVDGYTLPGVNNSTDVGNPQSISYFTSASTNNSTTISKTLSYNITSADTGYYLVARTVVQNSNTKYFNSPMEDMVSTNSAIGVAAPTNNSFPYFEILSGTEGEKGVTYRFYPGTWSNPASGTTLKYKYILDLNNVSGTNYWTYPSSSTFTTDTYYDYTFNSATTNSLAFYVQASNGSESDYAYATSSIPKINEPKPAIISGYSPAITGSGYYGDSHSCSTGSWTNSPTSYTYQWYYLTTGGWSSYSGATSSSWTPPASLTNISGYLYTIKCIVTATNANGSTPADSNSISLSYGSTSQITKPTISGGRAYGTTVTASSGTYNNAQSVSTRVWGVLSPGGSAPTDGVTSLTGGSTRGTTSSYTIAQSDVTSPIYLLYAVDYVTGYDGVVKYYFSSSYITPYVGNFTDNFNRSVTSGLGTSSYGLYWYSTLSNGSWQVNASYAITDAPTSVTSASGFRLYAMDMAYTSDRVMSVRFPGSTGGLGLCWWVTDSNNWWGSAINQYSSTANSTSYSCNGTSGNTSSCTVASNWSTNGGVCYCGSASTSTSYQCNVTGTSGLTSCTVATTASAGAICNCASSTTYTTHYYCTGSTGTLSSPCTVQADTAPYNYCYCDQTGTTTATTTYAFGSYYGSWGGASASTCNASNVGAAQSGTTQTYVGGGNYIYTRCNSTSTSTTTYAYQYTSTSSYQTSSTTYTSTKYDSGTTTTSYPYQNSTSSTTAITTYNTNIKIYSAVGGAITSRTDLNVNSNTTSYPTVWGMKVTVSGNSIYSSIYSDYALTTQIGSTATYTASSPTKNNATYGTGGAGLLAAKSDAAQGTYFDDLSMS